MRLRSALSASFLCLALVGLAGCEVFYTVGKVTHLITPPKFILQPEIPPDFKLSLDVRDVANPRTNYVLMFERSGKSSFEVEVLAPERRAHSGLYELTEDQVQSLWKAVRDAQFDEIAARYPESGDGPDKGNGVQKYYVHANNTEHQVESDFMLVPGLETIRKAALAVTPKEVMNATGAPGRMKAAPKEYVGDATTHLFHLPNCPRLKDLPPANRVAFPSATIALDYQFTPCPECSPLQPK